MLVTLAGLLAVAIAACGSSSSGTTASTPTVEHHATTAASPTAKTPVSAVQKLTLEANPTGELKYNKTTLVAHAGAASLTLTNNSPIAHNVTIEDSSGAKVAATTTFTGGAHTIPVNLKHGSYKFFCSVPGHRMAGMEGTLTVE
jgi:uncharacterized cupredoxin-like copper-binding protein